MARQNTRSTRARTRGPLTTSPTPDALTYEGAPAYTREDRSALFALATTDFGGESSFYETAEDRRTRFAHLVHAIAKADPLWLVGMLPWLRQTANMRTAALIGAIVFGRALDHVYCDGGFDADTGRNAPCGKPKARYWFAEREVWFCQEHAGPAAVLVSPRTVLGSVLQRADEPGEAVAYWASNYGRAMPKWFIRGVSDAALRLWNEHSAVKWDSPERAWRMADVMELTHPGGHDGQDLHERQRALFPWLLEHRHGRTSAKAPSEALPLLRERASLMAIPVADRRRVLSDPARLARAGFTWESLAGYLQSPMDAQAWQAIIPTMGYMALLRNLRNFDDAEIDRDVARFVADRIADPVQVRASKQLPFRFLSAYLATASDRWRQPLADALETSVENLPLLPGKTLVCIDVSGSMQDPVSERSMVQRWQCAALFAYALAQRGAAVTLAAFGTTADTLGWVRKSDSVLRRVDEFGGTVVASGRLGHGTNARHCVETFGGGHDRVVIFTDDQSRDGDPGSAVSPVVPVYTYDLGGYGRGASSSGPNRFGLAGYSDQSFAILEATSKGRDGRWPWEVKA